MQQYLNLNKIIFFLYILIIQLSSCSTTTYTVTNNQNNSTNEGVILDYAPHQSNEIIIKSGEQTFISIIAKNLGNTPISGLQIDFLITGEAGGSSLSTSTIVTNDEGVATISIIAGNSASHFQITAFNELTTPLVFDITVTGTETVDFEIALSYFGIYQIENFQKLETGMVFISDCSNININTVELFKQRTPNNLSEIVTYNELPTDIPFVFIARALNSQNKTIASVCAKPPEFFLQPGANANITLVLKDCIYQIPFVWETTEIIDSTALSNTLSEKLHHWSTIGNCPLGIAEKFLDCMLAYMENGNTEECIQGTPTTESSIIRDLRGIIDIKGCRTSINQNGDPSLEYKLLHLTSAFLNIQNALNEIQNSNLLFSQINIKSEWSNPYNLKIKHSLQTISFPRFSNEIHTLSIDNQTLDASSYENPLPVSNHTFQSNIINVALKSLWDKTLFPMNVAFTGEEVINYLKDSLIDMGEGNYYNALQTYICTNFTNEAIDNAFLLLKNYLPSPWIENLQILEYTNITLDLTDDNEDYTADSTPIINSTVTFSINP